MSILERYTIVRKLGHQSRRKFGELYLVENKASGNSCVLKTIKKTEKNNHLVNRLKHEAQFSFESSGLPTILDFHESSNEVLMIRKYIEGVTIDEYWGQLKRKERLPFFVKLVKELAEIQKILDKKGIVHADIKPSNIIVGADDAQTIHLIDFGLAIDRTNIDHRKTLFPLGFAAPELLLNQLDLVNASTDMYALGIMIWRLFTGKLPLTHPNPSIFTNLQLTHPLPNDHHLPKKLYPILLRMTMKHQFKIPPNKMKLHEVRPLLVEAMYSRYQSLEAIIPELEALNTKKRFLFLPKKIFSKS